MSNLALVARMDVLNTNLTPALFALTSFAVLAAAVYTQVKLNSEK